MVDSWQMFCYTLFTHAHCRMKPEQNVCLAALREWLFIYTSGER